MTNVFDLSELLEGAQKNGQPKAGSLVDSNVASSAETGKEEGSVFDQFGIEQSGQSAAKDPVTFYELPKRGAIKKLNPTPEPAIEDGQQEFEYAKTSTGTTKQAPEFFSMSGELRKPAYEIKEEKARHRAIIYALAAGSTPSEIAEELGYSKAFVYYVEKQPWARKQVADIIQQYGGNAVERMFKDAAPIAAKFLIDTVEGKQQCDMRTRSRNATEVLDRVFGKAQQFINHRNVEPSDLSDEELAKAVTTKTA